VAKENDQLHTGNGIWNVTPNRSPVISVCMVSVIIRWRLLSKGSLYPAVPSNNNEAADAAIYFSILAVIWANIIV